MTRAGKEISAGAEKPQKAKRVAADLGGQLSRDATVIRRAVKELDEGKGQEVGEFFNGLRAQLLAMKGDP